MTPRKLAALAAVLCRCVCADPDGTSEQYECSIDTDCVEGWECLDARCVRAGTACPQGTTRCATRCFAKDRCCTDADCAASGGVCRANFCVCPAGQVDCYGLCLDAAATCIPPPSELVFASLPQAVVSRACSTELLVEARDDAGVRRGVRSSTTVTFSEQGTLGVELFSDSACLMPVSSASLAPGQDLVRFFARSARAGSTSLEAAAPTLGTGRQDFIVLPGAPVGIGFQGVPPSVRYGSCAGLFEVEARDDAGNATPVTSSTAVTLAADITTVAFYSNGACSLPLPSPAILSAGNTALPFGLLATGTPGVVQLYADAGSLGTASQAVEVLPGLPAQLVFTSTTHTVQAGVCSPAVTVQLQDVTGTNTTAVSPLSLAFSGANMTFFPVAGCPPAMSVNGATLAAGSGATTFYFRATTAGSVPLTVRGGGLSAQQSHTVTPLSATRLDFTTGLQGVATSQCSGPTRLSSLDMYGNPSNVLSALPITLSAAPGTGFSFFDGPGCTGSPVTAVSIQAATNSVTFSFRGDNPGQVAMTADSTLEPDPTQVALIGATMPASLVWVTGAQTLEANRCSAPLTIEARDSAGNRSNLGGALPITLDTGGLTGLQFFSDPSCSQPVSSVSIAAGAARVSFWLKGTVAGSTMLRMAATVPPVGTLPVTIQAGPASQLSFSSAMRSVTAGACTQAMTVETRDAYGNASPVVVDATLTLSGSGAVTFHSDTACASAPLAQVSIPRASSAASFYAKPTRTPSQTALVHNPTLGSASQNIGVTSATDVKLVFTTPARVVAAGGCSSVVTVERRDVFDNPGTQNLATVSLAADGGPMTFYTSANCAIGTATVAVSLAAGVSAGNVYLSNTAAGSRTLTARAGSLMEAVQPAIVTVAPPTQLAFDTPARSVVAGVCSPVITVETRDQYLNASPVAVDSPVTLSTADAGAGVTFYADNGCVTPVTGITIATGTASADLWAVGTRSGGHLLTATSSIDSGTQPFTVDAGPLAGLKFFNAPQSVPVGLCSAALQVRSVDAFDNPTFVSASTPVSVTVSPDGGVLFYQSTCGGLLGPQTLTASNNTLSLAVMGGMVAQPVTLTASASGLDAGTHAMTVGAAVPTQFVFTTPPRSVMAGECAVVTVEAQNGQGNAGPLTMPSVPFRGSTDSGVTLFSDSACDAGGPVLIPMGSSAVTFSARGVTGGTPNLIAPTSGTVAGASQPFTVAPVVRTGTCIIVATDNSQDCPITIPLPLPMDLSKTFFVFQATNTQSLDDAAVRCELTTNNPPVLRCSRGGTQGQVNIRWHTVTRPSGMTVQHFPAVTASSGSGMSVSQPITPVVRASSFVLMSASVPSGQTNFLAERFASAELVTAGNAVDIRRYANADVDMVYSLQVVEWAGATVDHGSATIANNSLSASANLSTQVGPVFVLYSWRYGSASSITELCRHAVYGMVSSPTLISFSRDSTTGANCDSGALIIDYQRVAIPGQRIDNQTVNITTPSVTVSLSGGPVDTSRSIAFTGATTFAGQSMGETEETYANLLAESVARMSLVNNGTQLSVQREGSASGNSRFGVFIWQIDP